MLHQPVVNGNQRLGTLYVESDLAALYELIALYGALIGGILILSCLVALPLSNHLQRHISRPVLELVRTATAVAEQRDYSARAGRFGDDELGRLTDVFNAMLGQIQAQDAALRTREDHLRQEIADRTKAEAEVLTLNGSLERRVHERTEALEAANQELEAFSYTVSHDLRAPLRHIHGYSEMLRRATSDGELSDKAQRYVSTIIAASTEMGVLIDDLLAFSRMGRTEIRSFEVSLSELVTETVLGLELALKDRQIVWQIAPLPPAIGDRAMIKQVLANLIGNAVKYTRMREPAHIDIGCAGEEDGRMILFVRDNGAGFDPQYAHKLFGVFQRLHRAEEFEGSGIGLATVRRITTRHGGRVWAEGALDEGATFYFTLQHAWLLPTATAIDERAPMTVLKRILLAEDSPRDAELALDALADNHLANEVVHVRDGAEALDYLHRRGEFAGRSNGEPAVVLLDLKMPKVDGLEVLRDIKADPHLKLIPVVVMTSSREEGDMLRSYELGVNAYVVKPMNFHALVEAVKQVGSFWGIINEPPPGSLRRSE